MDFDRDLANLTAGIVSTTVHADRWQQVCDRITDKMGATGFMVFEYDFQNFGAQIFHSSTAFLEAGAQLMAQTMEGVPDEEMEGYALLSRQPSGVLIGEYELYGVPHDRDMPPNPFRNRVLAAGGSKSRNIARLNDVGPWADVAALHMPCYGADVPKGVKTRMNFLVGIIAKALEAGRIVRGLAGAYRTLLDAFDRFDFGAALLERDGRVVIANRAFRDIAAERDGLTQAGGIAGATHREDSAALRRIVANAFSPAAPASDLIATLRRRSGALPLVAKAAPVRDPEAGRATLALLLVIDPEDGRRLSAEGLAAFGLLSPAELEVCDHLVRGAATEEIAERRSTTLQTTRDQIKSASAKLACRSRLDLVRLALSTRPPARED